MIGLDLHDVVVFGHRPIWPEHRVLAVMHRRFPAQPVEIRPERIGLEQLGIGDIEFRKRKRSRVVARGPLMGLAGEIDRSVHRASPKGCCPAVVSSGG
jgi:hypothetical protein